jgi:putative sterol carrier protein
VVAKWLSQDWLDESTRLAESQPERPGATARLQYVITGGPDGEVKYYWIVEDGHLVENRLGELADAEVTLTETYDDAMRMQKGELDVNAAFMQGRIKVDGDVGKLMALLPITMSPEFGQFQESVRAITEY